jgi:hypothetical protein
MKNVESILFLLPGLGCALAMVLCMGMIGRGMRPPDRSSTGAGPSDADAIAAPREEVARLRARQSLDAANGDG